MNMTKVTHTFEPVPGFRASSLHCGLKTSRPDIALLVNDGPTPAAAGIFTQNQVVAAPVLVSRAHLKASCNAQSAPRAFIVNAGNANACTGQEGLRTAQTTCETVAQVCGIKQDDVLVASTGVIGVELPVNLVTTAVPALYNKLSAAQSAFTGMAGAIMTTDTVKKVASASVAIGSVTYTVSGMAKGSGMIKPSMATTIGCVLTDAPLSCEALDAVLRQTAEVTFNRLTVDGDTSTNDTLLAFASGATVPDGTQNASELPESNGHAHPALVDAFHGVLAQLACAIAADGEGATKRIEVNVVGAHTSEDAQKIAFTVAESPLVKTALFGNDANWGRVAAAAGRAGVSFDQEALSISFAGHPVLAQGLPVAFDEATVKAALEQPVVELVINVGECSEQDRAHALMSLNTLHPAPGCARVQTCDLSYDYVRINGDYRS